MAKDKVYALPNVTTPSRPVIFTDKCKGCNLCVEVCPVDVYIPHPEKGKAPIILHPDECWYCGSCVHACNIAGRDRVQLAVTAARLLEEQSDRRNPPGVVPLLLAPSPYTERGN